MIRIAYACKKIIKRYNLIAMSSQEHQFATPPPYWGPFPGETPELYEKLGVWKIYKAIKPHFPTFFIGDFSMKHGIDTDINVARRREPNLPDPNQLTKQDKLERYVEWTKRNEKTHIIGFFGFMALTALILQEQDSTSGIFASAVAATNVAINVYPIMLQRYNRLKAYRALGGLSLNEPGGQ